MIRCTHDYKETMVLNPDDQKCPASNVFFLKLDLEHLCFEIIMIIIIIIDLTLYAFRMTLT